MNIPNGISDMDIDKVTFGEQLESLATLALKDGCTVTNPIQPSKEELKRIYQDTFQGKW